MEKQLGQLTDRLRKAYGDQLVGVLLYGSATSTDFNQGFSDLNVLCVLTQVGVPQLRVAEPIFHWWEELGNPAPLLLSEEEVATSTDCFAIEFHDMLDHRRVLYGRDVIEGLSIDHSFYRAQVEYELRAKLLRLRQKAGDVLDDRELLARLMADSVSTFLILARHALKLAGLDPGASRRDTALRLAESMAMEPTPLLTLLDFRQGTAGLHSFDASALFAQYLKLVQALVDFVDRVQK